MSDTSDRILKKIIDEFENRNLLDKRAMDNEFGHKGFDEISNIIDEIID